MRNVAMVLALLAWTALFAGNARASEGDFPVGKSPAWEVRHESPPQHTSGVAEETPNHKRKRLGLPIVATFPPPDYGEAIETPNQLRQKLRSAREISLPTDGDYGKIEETPNQARKRLALADTK